MRRIGAFMLVGVLTASTAAMAPSPSVASYSSGFRQWVADHIGDTRRLSLGAKSWLLGPEPVAGRTVQAASNPSFGTNVNANDPSRDLAAGQSETAVAAASGRVLVAWNDATGFLFNDSTQVRASMIGVGFSNDGGASFTDLLGLPNDNPHQQWAGDPSVAALGRSNFIVGGLYFPSFFTACDDGGPAELTLAISVAHVNKSGTQVTFSSPIVVASAGNVCEFETPDPTLSLLDKPFLSYNRTSRTLAMSYTRISLGIEQFGLGQIEIARAQVPKPPGTLSSGDFETIEVWQEEPFCFDSSEENQCGAVNQGSYPAVAPNGDTFVLWERNWISNLFFSGDPYVYIHGAFVPFGASAPNVGGRTDPRVVTLGQVNSNPDGGVRSMVSVGIAGYGLGNDFPRVAVNVPLGRVVVVWNDASSHPLGDVWMRAYDLSFEHPSRIRRVNDDPDSTLHFLPAVSVRDDGTICTSWYDRRLGGPDSTRTDYFGECRPNVGSPGDDFRITTGSTRWAGTSSLFGPDFGDYTDNASDGSVAYFTWADGRLGVPQPFVDSH